MRSYIALAITSIIIFTIGIAIRVPSCSESFWVDELHTAWTIHDDLTDVFPRAQIGHQQPYYFGLLWLWRQVFGESELALRMTSVLAVAIASVVVNVAVARSTKNLIAGFASGMFLAIESNSIFFGTELRPYAMVMLASAAACSFAHFAWNDKPADRGATWVMLFVSIGIAGAMQLTSLGILAWLPVAVFLRWCWVDWRSAIRLQKTDVVVLMAVVVTALLLLPGNILETWNERSIWASFASTQYIDDLWELWPWLVGLILPAAWLLLNQMTNSDTPKPDVSFTLLLAVILVVSSFCLWLIAYLELAPLWHRRFLIAGLPMLAWCFGSMVGSGSGQGRAARNSLNVMIALLLLWTLASWSQNTLPRILRFDVKLVTRGEDWRGAVAYLNSHVKLADAVVVDPGLIEQVAWHQDIVSASLSHEKASYLAYALSGPYMLKHQPSVVASNLLPIRHWAISHHDSWIISRRPAKRLRQSIEKVVDATTSKITVRSFGRVSVARIETKMR